MGSSDGNILQDGEDQPYAYISQTKDTHTKREETTTTRTSDSLVLASRCTVAGLHDEQVGSDAADENGGTKISETSPDFAGSAEALLDLLEVTLEETCQLVGVRRGVATRAAGEDGDGRSNGRGHGTKTGDGKVKRHRGGQGREGDARRERSEKSRESEAVGSLRREIVLSRVDCLRVDQLGFSGAERS